MRKTNIALWLSLPLISIATFTACDKGNYRSREDAEIIPIDPSVKGKTVSELTEEQYIHFPSLFLNHLLNYKSYKSVTEGQTIAAVFGTEFTQSINVLNIKSDYSYLKNESHSDLVNTVHVAYYHDSKAVYTDSDSYSASTIEDYLKIYGTYPHDKGIEGYTIGEGAIVSVEKLESEENYKFRVTFDKDKSTNNVKIQMKKFGGLDDYPTFTQDIVMTITVKNDFTPITLELDSHYDSLKTMFIQVTSACHQTYTVTYSNFDEEIETPDLEKVINMFDTVQEEAQ